jgi:hypothetical protein
MGNQAGALVEVAVGDEADAWRSIGFAVAEGGTCLVGRVGIRFTGQAGDPEGGIAGWTLAGLPIEGGDVDGLATTTGRPTGDVVGADTATGAATRLHPNGVVQLDHLVILTPDLDRTTGAFEAIGLEARRTREAGRGRLQRFFRLGEVILEVVGPVEPSGDGPARFWGFAFTVVDIDATAAHLGERVGRPKPAVQPGRRIATLRSQPGVSVPVAFMSGDEATGLSGGARL